MNTEEKIKKRMEDIKQAMRHAHNAYFNFVKACDNLAELAHYKEDWILMKLLPSASHERRDEGRIVNFLSDIEPTIERHLKEIAKIHSRDELIESLKLTDDQKAILFPEED